MRKSDKIEGNLNYLEAESFLSYIVVIFSLSNDMSKNSISFLNAEKAVSKNPFPNERISSWDFIIFFFLLIFQIMIPIFINVFEIMNSNIYNCQKICYKFNFNEK